MYSSEADNNWLKIYSENRQLFARFFRQRISDPEDCEDLQQELFIRIHKLDQKTNINDPRAYLFRIAYNLVNDLLRKRQRNAPLSNQTVDEIDIAEDTYTAEATVIDRERLKLLEEAIASLPMRCREVFLLRKVDDLSTQEIAAFLGISRNMVEKHLRNALTGCRKYLEKKSS